MKRNITLKVISLVVAFVLHLSGGLFAQNLTPAAGSTQTINVPSSGYTSFSDPGGPGGSVILCSGINIGTVAQNYPNCNCITLTTVCHDVPGTPVELDFTQYAVNAVFDSLKVFNGNSTAGAVLYSNSNTGAQTGDRCTGPGNVIATNPSGCLTVLFSATASVNDAGFIANIIAGPVSNDDAGVTITNPTNPTTATLQNVQVRLKNYGLNTINTATIEWTINGVVQTPFSYVGPALAVGDSSAPITIGSFTPANGDVVRAWSSLPNSIVDTVNANDTARVDLCIGLAGTFTIDAGQATAGTNYASFQAAVNAMTTCGIAGPVVFNVVPGSGPYTEQVTLPAIAGTSATNTITFNGNGDTLQWNPDINNRFVLRFNGADYVTIDSLYVLSTNATYGYGILFSNESDYNTIRQSTVNVNAVTSTTATNSGGIVFSASPNTNTGSGANGSFNKFEENTIINGYYGVRTNTGGSVSNEFLNNRILESYFYAMYFSGGNNATIVDGNEITRPTRSTITTFYGIYFTGNSENCVINGNRIHNTAGGNPATTSNHFGIYHTTCDATPGNENIVSNNLIYNINNNSQINAIYNGGSDGITYLHNTIDLSSTTTTTTGNTYGVYQTTAATGLVFIGNVIKLSRTGINAHVGFYINTSTTVFTENYNVVFSNAPTGSNGYGYYNAITYPTLAAWQTATSQGANSLSVDPLFASPGTGDFTPGNPSFNNIVPNQGVTEDFFGTPRGAFTDAGAIEFSGVPNDIGAFAIVSPPRIITATTQTVEVQVRNYGTNTVNAYNVGWSVNGVAQTGTSSATPLAPSTNSAPITLGTYVPTNFDTIRSWTSLPNGVADAFAPNDTTTLITCVGLQGTFTIDASLPTGGSNYASFTAAVSAMAACGITGPVVFNVAPLSGPYVEQVIIPFINGSSATNTITFNGNGDTLQFSPPALLKYVLKLEGAQYVTIDSLVIRSLSGTYGYGILLSAGADNNNITNNIIDVSLVTSTTESNSTGIVISGSNTSQSTNAPFTGSNNLIQDNAIIGGYHGVSIYGSTTGTGADNNRIIGNDIRDFYNSGVLLSDNSNTRVLNNDISRPARVAVTTFHGVELLDNTYGALIDANRIYNTHGAASSLTGTVYGIYFNSSDADSARPNVVTNNLIYDIKNTGVFYGVYNTGSNNNRVLHNTIVVDQVGSTGTSAVRGFFQTTTATNVHFKNNIVYIVREGSTASKYGVYLGTTTSDVTLDGNVYYLNSSTGLDYVGFYNAVSYDTITTWQTANTNAYDQNSFQRNPRFADIATDNYAPTSAVINDQGEPVGILTDFFGAPRSATTPDPGAIEFVPLADDAATIALLSPSAPLAPGNYPIEVVIQNLGIANLTDVNVYVNINDGVIDTTLPVFVHSPILLPSLVSDTITIGTFDFLSPSYTITIWTSDPNGGADANNVNDTLTVNLCLALPAGNYTINSALATGSGNYQSFNAAAAALTCGILGNVVFDVVPGSGPYSEQVTIGEVIGAGPAATITFNGQGETLTHDGTVKFATLTLLGTDYVTVRNLTIESTSNVQGFGVHLTSNANFNTIKNSTVRMSNTTTNTTNYAISASASETSATAEGNNANYLWVDSSIISGGYRGIGLEGAPGILLKGNRITNTTFLNQFNAALFTDDQDSMMLYDNYVDSLRDLTNGDGFFLTDLNGYFEIEGNIVFTPDWGIYINDANTADSSRRARVVNNMVRSVTDMGIDFVDASHVDVFHNTVVGNPAVFLTTGTTRMDIRNNIFSSPNDYAFEDGVAIATSNHVDVDNNIYESGSATLLIKYGGTTTAFDYATLVAWQTAYPALNQNSLEGDPVFVSNNDLHILGTLPNDVGDNTAGVIIDIDGDSRPLSPSTTVDIGADEYLPFTSNVAVTNIISPSGNACGDSSTAVTVVLYNFGTAAQSNFDVQVAVTGAITQTLSATYAGPIAPQTFDTITVGNINTYAGGTLNLFAEHLLASDQFPQNDTLSAVVEVLAIPSAPVAVGDTGCVGDVLELTADFGTFIDLEWFDDANLTNSVGSGDVLFTPTLASTQTYYVVGTEGSFERVGRSAATSSTGFLLTTNQGSGWGLEFEVFAPTFIDSVTIYPEGSGTISLAYYNLNNGNSRVDTTTSSFVSGTGLSTPVQIYVGWLVQPGRYNIGIHTYTGLTDLIRDSGIPSNSFPYTSPSGGLSITSGKSAFTTITTTSYYWFYDWVLRLQGCSSPAQEVVAFISDTQSDAGADDTICAGETASLTAQNGVAWVWTGGLSTQTINVSPASTTTYSLTVTDAFGCAGTLGQATVIVNQLPNVTIGNDTAVCDGESVVFGAVGAIDYVWSTAAITPTITVTDAGTYSVTGTDANGCINEDTVALVVRSLPTGNAGADDEICAGDSAQLVATGGVSYVWNTTETTANITVSPTTTSDYTVTTTDQFGCVGADTVELVVRNLPSGNAGADDEICAGDSAQLVASGGVSYVWNTTETTTNITVSPTTTSDYTVTTTDQFGCVGTDTVTVAVNQLPVLNITTGDTICISQIAVTLTASPAGGTFTGPGVVAGVFDPTTVGLGTYTITYNYTDAEGCSDTATKAIVVSNVGGCTPGVGTLAGIEVGSIYPNPFQGNVNIEFTAINSEPVTITMYNLLGQTIFTAQVAVNYGLNTYTIETDGNLAEGFYVIELRKGSDTYMEKLLRVK